MATRQEWVQHPEQIWIRRCLFQGHLWVGAVAGAYVALMSVTGSMIVFRNEMERLPSLVKPVEFLVNLHENLLLGRAGRFINGIGAIAVLLLCFTGAVIWWPGIAHWRRALTIHWRALFARFTWDLHSALGFWGFLFVLMWSLSGLYFCFPDAVNRVFWILDTHDHFTSKGLFWFTSLHFGRFGLFAETVWTVLGLLPTILALTGVFLCCRRMIYKLPSPHRAAAPRA